LVSVYYSIPLRDSFRGLSSRKPELLIARTKGRDQFPHFLVFRDTERDDQAVIAHVHAIEQQAA
jgi:hypothetical protein